MIPPVNFKDQAHFFISFVRLSSDGILSMSCTFVTVNFMESTLSESTEYVLYYMVRLRRSVRIA